MQEYNVVLTWEAIYDIAEMAGYIESEFGISRADQFQRDMQNVIAKLGYMGDAFPKTQLLYRDYAIHKRVFPPSIIFYVCLDQTGELHVLRVLREEEDWERSLKFMNQYTYPYAGFEDIQ